MDLFIDITQEYRNGVTLRYNLPVGEFDLPGLYDRLGRAYGIERVAYNGRYVTELETAPHVFDETQLVRELKAIFALPEYAYKFTSVKVRIKSGRVSITS